ncbi:uncharacterized protein EI97DRAFT_454002 [Westerdykella ornata]|uniref:Uncharacterized protein n=1 Tax=Westerdykella ornata TaxID=318751 RepID=A0A6A6JVX2_WESOR|nr:uncharacterized protein EI97DRAFT_454002 [Westerdykella ornata]KAF2280752.1 hypothetical protein EI97DRAFT_454002 [Westerdykella ornata]
MRVVWNPMGEVPYYWAFIEVTGDKHLSNQNLVGRLVYVREDREAEPRFSTPSVMPVSTDQAEMEKAISGYRVENVPPLSSQSNLELHECTDAVFVNDEAQNISSCVLMNTHCEGFWAQPYFGTYDFIYLQR